MNCIIASFFYIISDPFFWPSMAFTTMVGIFIGAVIYDGIVSEVKKMIASLACYAMLIITVNLTRVVPLIPQAIKGTEHQLFASVETMALVTAFYLLGTYLGVRITKKAQTVME
jgi:hypothetical protein